MMMARRFQRKRARHVPGVLPLSLKRENDAFERDAAARWLRRNDGASWRHGKQIERREDGSMTTTPRAP